MKWQCGSVLRVVIENAGKKKGKGGLKKKGKKKKREKKSSHQQHERIWLAYIW